MFDLEVRPRLIHVFMILFGLLIGALMLDGLVSVAQGNDNVWQVDTASEDSFMMLPQTEIEE